MESSSYSLYSRKKVWDRNADLRKKEEMKKYTKGTPEENKPKIPTYTKVTITIGG